MGYGRSEVDLAAFIAKQCVNIKADPRLSVEEFTSRIAFHAGGYDSDESYERLGKTIGGFEGGKPGNGRDVVRVQHRPVDAANTGNVHERISGPPLGVTHQLELAEPAVIARLRDGRLTRRVGDQ